MEVIFFSLAGACIIYFIIIVIYSGIATSFCGIWLALAAVFILMGCFQAGRLRRKGGMPRKLPIFIYTSFVMAVGIFAATMYLVVSATDKRAEDGMDYVIVVGDRVFDTGISTALRLKLDRAYEYYLDNEDTIFVLSGGQTEGDPVPEAMAMYNYLYLKGVPEANMLIEMSSVVTRQNIVYSGSVIDRDLKRHHRGLERSDLRVGILTSDFNMYRALKYARTEGYGYICGISTSTDLVLYPHECVRESCALVMDFLKGERI